MNKNLANVEFLEKTFITRNRAHNNNSKQHIIIRLGIYLFTQTALLCLEYCKMFNRSGRLTICREKTFRVSSISTQSPQQTVCPLQKFSRIW